MNNTWKNLSNSIMCSDSKPEKTENVKTHSTQRGSNLFLKSHLNFYNFMNCFVNFKIQRWLQKLFNLHCCRLQIFKAFLSFMLWKWKYALDFSNQLANQFSTILRLIFCPLVLCVRFMQLLWLKELVLMNVLPYIQNNLDWSKIVLDL